MNIHFIVTNNQEDEDGYTPQFANTIRPKTLKKFSPKNGKSVEPKKDAPNSWRPNTPSSATSERIK